ncbi:MAG: hypothetical protein GX567_04830, partial [Clostridia bacterium]|nr:hypothetical protein [Clostridia bacterium]
MSDWNQTEERSIEDTEYIEIENQNMEDVMTYERRETIFDHKDVNWGAMVSEQAELFENIKQYRINLQLDIDTLDSRIEDLML